mgnify:CR=1 FL=1
MYKYRRVIISVIALLLAAAILTGLLVTVFAANSADIRTEISGSRSSRHRSPQTTLRRSMSWSRRRRSIRRSS